MLHSTNGVNKPQSLKVVSDTSCVTGHDYEPKGTQRIGGTRVEIYVCSGPNCHDQVKVKPAPPTSSSWSGSETI